MRKRLTAIVLAVLAFSMIAASAASLGGITTSNLGAETDTVAGCDPDGIAVDFTVVYNATTGEYDTDTVNISDIASPACEGQTISATLTDSAGASLGSASTILGASQTSWNAPISAPADEVFGIAVIIDG